MRILLHSIWDQPDAESVAAQYDRIIDALADKLPKVAEHLEGADLAARSGPTTPRSGSTRRSVGAPTSSASFPTEAP